MPHDKTLNISDLEKRLLTEQLALRDIENTGDSATEKVELDQSRVGRLSRMDALQAQAMSIASKQRRTLRLKLIGAALRRIENDDYGYCAECDEAINPLRLNSDPAASLCINCANLLES